MSPRGITPPHTSGPTAGASAPPIRRASMPAQPWHGFFRGLAAGLAGLLRRQDAAPAAPLAAWERAAITRRRVFLALIALSTTIATALMAQVQPPYQHPALQYGQIVLFALLFAWVSAGFFTAVMGFYVMLRGDRHALSRQDVRHDPIRPDARTAIIMPICNEHVSTVFAGLRATCESLANSGAQQLFDVYVLSDTSDPDIRSAEIKAWGELRETLGDNARIYYRWRQRRTKRKAGNVADFCRRWGRNYRYMVVLDADSVMSGDCLVNLVRLMEANPKAGIIQTAPQAVGHATIHARSQQFASRVTGRLFTLGMAYWQLGESHYWGHNAIIRVEPFMKHCGLAPLPGRGALSGEIMSHDFVEAALMRRAGYHVWLATDLTGSYEQQPPNLLEELQRDRRWCQGNLQNARLIAEPGLHAVHRAMLATGALAYASAPLWLAFVVLGVALWLTGGLGASVTAFGLPIAVGGLWVGTLAMLVLPRVLGIAGILLRSEQRFYGGTAVLLKSALLEAGLSVLQAPVRMVAHSVFVFAALTGWRIDWKSPPREAESLRWRDAARRLLPSTSVILGAAVAAAAVNPALMLWMAPIALPLLMAVPLAVFTSQEGRGRRVSERGLLRIPEETWTPAVLRHAWSYAARQQRPTRWADVLQDESLFDLVRTAMGNRHTDRGRRALARRQLLLDLSAERSAESLAPTERMRFLSEPQSLEQLRLRHSILRGQVYGRQLARDMDRPRAAPHALAINSLRPAGGNSRTLH
ncbi:glucans biosynthesis glucosyltransferase MdoH [Caldimonas thermodepolymerans]|uniref:Glucans biosynthesis glucosyltransferase H n=1 Tax=Caldimonas thermodepolymerans TaxID=215580 RepID=A0AA46DHJ3_9BURK|nr:glucans biosynthesis glucosyltransferase MdoH [Caldimonas thermodepolymerans]TCP09933.1 membrane glycosyltransferase [Caldimonas thermodepolymerans]UZG46319.1 glucans biosynthesis glucosyltransferase MdoH [Caldimonas thermodepolymerans]